MLLSRIASSCTEDDEEPQKRIKVSQLPANSTQVSQTGELSRLMERALAGISAGIDMSLHLVSRLYGLEVVHWTGRRMEYDWRVTE
jgi:hypothetical protein